MLRKIQFRLAQVEAWPRHFTRPEQNAKEKFCFPFRRKKIGKFETGLFDRPQADSSGLSVVGNDAHWLPGSEGAGVGDVLFGDYKFTGQLPLAWNVE